MKRRTLAASTAALLIAGGAFVAPSSAFAADTCIVDSSTIEECFPDSAIASKVAQAMGLGPYDTITSTDIAALTRLTVQRVTDLSGVEHLTGLTKLEVSGGGLTDITPLASLSNLRELSLLRQNLGDLSPLAQLSELRVLNLEDSKVTDVSPLASLNMLEQLNVKHNKLRSLEPLASIPGLNIEWSGNLVDSPTIPFSRGLTIGEVVLKSGADSIPSNFASAYFINGTEHTFSSSYGDGSHTLLADSTGVFEKVGPGVSVLGDRGDTVTSSLGQYNRSVTREVQADGTIEHYVTMTNATPAPITTRFYDSLDTELDGTDSVPILAAGATGFSIENNSIRLFLEPIDGIEQAFAGQFSKMYDLQQLVEQNRPSPSPLFAAGSVPSGTALISGIDTAVYYVTPEVTLAPGESYKYSYRETLYETPEQPSIWVEYRDETSGEIVDGSFGQLYQGAKDSILSLDASKLTIPAGYELSKSISLPLDVSYGSQGPRAVVRIPVVAMSATVTHTVTFNTLGGTAIDPAEVDEGTLLTLPTAPSKEGFKFLGWAKSEDGSIAFDETSPIAESLTLWAIWSKIDVPVDPVTPVDQNKAQPSTQLPNTGGENLRPWLITGAGIALLGAALVFAARRNKRA